MFLRRKGGQFLWKIGQMRRTAMVSGSGYYISLKLR
jgi:hypothetical protein